MAVTDVKSWPTKVNSGVSNDDPLIDVTFNKRKYNYEDIDPYLEEAADKHITGVRNRYPMLTKLLMNARAPDTANLSSAANTDKYARLADAYNAQYVRMPITFNSVGTGTKGGTSIGNANWQAINPISTQDQKQMETRRQTEGKLYDYVIGEESYAQRQLLENRLREMWLRLEQEYDDEFFDTNEEKKRISAMFEMWRGMTEEEFTQLLNKMHVPAIQSQYVSALVKKNQFFEAMNFLVNNGHSAMLGQEALNMFMQGDILSNYLNGFLGPDEAYKAFGQLKGQEMITQVTGLLQAARESGETGATLANSFEKAVGGVAGLTEYAIENPLVALGALLLGNLASTVAPAALQGILGLLKGTR